MGKHCPEWTASTTSQQHKAMITQWSPGAGLLIQSCWSVGVDMKMTKDLFWGRPGTQISHLWLSTEPWSSWYLIGDIPAKCSSRRNLHMSVYLCFNTVVIRPHRWKAGEYQQQGCLCAPSSYSSPPPGGSTVYLGNHLHSWHWFRFPSRLHRAMIHRAELTAVSSPGIHSEVRVFIKSCEPSYNTEDDGLEEHTLAVNTAMVLTKDWPV